MNDETENGAAGGAAQQPQQQAQQPQQQQPAPQLRMLAQYVRDLSFENPAAGKPMTARPDIQINVSVDARKPEGDAPRHEVSLRLTANATAEGADVFICELDYVGLFQIDNAPDQILQPILLVECPRLLFPFARRVMADATRDGGYPPLMLDPIDFVTLFRQQLQQRAAAQAAKQQEPGNA